MIYSTPSQLFPLEDQYHECHSFLDENAFVWKIARIHNGFFVGFFGDDYFKDTYFDVSFDDQNIVILNTGCFFIHDDSFETYYHFREILKNGYTDDIWESIEELIIERLKNNPQILECERRADA